MSALDRAIAIANGVAGLAARLETRPQNVNNWRRRGVPANQCARIAVAVDHAVTPHQLRPDVFPAPGPVDQDQGRLEEQRVPIAGNLPSTDNDDVDPDRGRIDPDIEGA